MAGAKISLEGAVGAKSSGIYSFCGCGCGMTGVEEGVQILWHRSSFNHCNSAH